MLTVAKRAAKNGCELSVCQNPTYIFRLRCVDGKTTLDNTHDTLESVEAMLNWYENHLKRYHAMT